MKVNATKLLLSVTLLTLLSQSAWGGWTLVQSAFDANQANGTSLTLSVSPTGSQHTLIVGVMGTVVGVSVSGITDNATASSNSYQSLGARAISNAANTFTELWCVSRSNPGATSITVQYSGPSGFRGVGLWEVSGLDGCRKEDGEVTNNGSASITPFGPAVVTASTGTFIVSLINVSEGITGIHSGNAFTNDSTVTGGGWAHLTSNSAAAGSYQAQWDQDASGTFAASTVAIALPIVIPDLPGPSGVPGLSSWWQSADRAGDYSSGEIQCYKPANIAVTGGNLVITNRQESIQCGDLTHGQSTFNYTGGMILWKKFNFTYGTIEIRAKFPGGAGPWPSFWMIGADCQPTFYLTADDINTCQWPIAGSDEIDIAETLNSDLTHMNQQIHTGGVAAQTALYNDGCNYQMADVSDAFHTYQVDWSAGVIVWKVDGVTSCIVSQHVPSTPMMLMINSAMGGAGGSINNATLPQTFVVDYVKVIQNGHTVFFDDFIPRPRSQVTSY